MKYLILLFLFIATGIHSEAKIWRINNNVGFKADFAQGTAAIASSSVVNDDTLYFEASATQYEGFTLSKRLVLIGAGYFISGANSNPGLQANTNISRISNHLLLDPNGSGSKLMGLTIDAFQPTYSGTAFDNITLTRCNINYINHYTNQGPNTKMTGWVVNKCYIYEIGLSAYVLENWQLTNNIITYGIVMNNTGNFNILMRNNVLRSSVTLYSAYFSNNIVTGSLSVASLVNTTIKNNISTGAGNLPADNNNINGQSDADLFQGLTGNSTDGQWRLKAGSTAIGAGETIAGITPDCGAFGTADPYVLSGIPPIPTIYKLTVPASVSSSASDMPITVSTKSHN